MSNFTGPRGAIAYESNILARLAREGWRGPVETLRTLAHHGRRLGKRYETSCNYEWAGTEKYDRDTERAEARLIEIATKAGLQIHLQTDPRGEQVYVAGPDAVPVTASNYSTMAACLYFPDRSIR